MVLQMIILMLVVVVTLPGSSQRDEFGASSSNQTQPALRNIIQKEDIVKVEGEFVVDTHKLIQHISELLELRRKGKLRQKQPSKVSRFFEWPSVPGFNRLKEILSSTTDCKQVAELVKSGLDLVSALKDIISGPVKILLTDIGNASLATAGLLLVAYTLEGFDNLSSNQDECWFILEQMSFVANVVERLEASPKVIQDLIEGATILIAEGAIMCCSKMDSSPWKKFFSSQKIKQDLSDIRKRLSEMYMQINIEIGFRILTAIESKGRSPLSKGYPTLAVGIDEPIEEVLRLLKIKSDDQNVVTVILQGFGGMGKTTLADAVFSKVGGCKYSKVQLPEDIKPSVIIKLQKKILGHLMEPAQNIPDIAGCEDGQRELVAVLKKVQAFIYIDNVLKPDALGMLLPEDLTEAKKVRILLTARKEEVKLTCPRPCTKPEIYKMKCIQHQDALIILRREITEGITEEQFKEIIDTCDGIPLKLRVTAPVIGRADDQQEAYAKLMEGKQKANGSLTEEKQKANASLMEETQKANASLTEEKQKANASLMEETQKANASLTEEKLMEKKQWTGKASETTGYNFVYDALPLKCKDPFLDVCTYFNDQWKWDKVEDIVGQDVLGELEKRALVTRTPDGYASVHDEILELARQMSKEVRLKFTNASELKKFLEEKDTKGIKGIWLTTNTDELSINASTLEPMRDSLRVLRVGKVEGSSNEIFKELVFFEAKISQLPFDDVSRLEQLRYLSCSAHTLMPSTLPSKLRFMDFDGRMFREVPKATVNNDEDLQ